MRSTIEVAKSTWESIQSGSVSSTKAARSVTTVWVTGPFSGRLSQERIVIGPESAPRLAIRPATSLAGNELTTRRGLLRRA